MAGMGIAETELEGVVIINNPVFNDLRGDFIKVYNEDMFKKYNLCTNFKESYYTISQKDVVRGMHFQKPPYDHEELVYVAKGKIIDVILDLRKNSKTYKKVYNYRNYRGK